MSMDVRILFKNSQYYRKLPGGYFRLFEDLESNDSNIDNNKYFLSYSENNTKFTQNIPIHLQRLQIKEYCSKYDISFKFEQVELNGLFHAPVLQGLIAKDKPEALLMFSIYALPDNEEKRNNILDLFIDNNVEVHFVNENLILRTSEDRNKIKKIRNFTLDNSSPIEELSKILETS
jgi:sporadic carbohydrate cluster protein (TIGR04323 family)